MKKEPSNSELVNNEMNDLELNLQNLQVVRTYCVNSNLILYDIISKGYQGISGIYENGFSNTTSTTTKIIVHMQVQN